MKKIGLSWLRIFGMVLSGVLFFLVLVLFFVVLDLVVYFFYGGGFKMSLQSTNCDDFVCCDFCPDKDFCEVFNNE